MIPITDRVVVMPLIGVMDARRGQQVLETALYGAKESRAKVVILDITGMKLVDAGVAGALVNAAGGLRLLGAQVVITGIRPDVALALVDLNLDIGKILTFGTLQGGIAHALRQTGDKAR
jgi:anti-anti-sigma regulatory factor